MVNKEILKIPERSNLSFTLISKVLKENLMSRNGNYTYAFEKLEVWQLARKMKTEIYEITQTFPNEERYGLVNQIRRSMGSVTANLAEGSGRASHRDRARFTNIAFASALETLDHIITAFDLSFINESMYRKLRTDLDELINKLNAFYKYQTSLN